ncbi:hypothetical protein AGR4C_Cc90011 [Agrobacterium tumefaciens str. Kerr 14]|uniref:Uncharacterized protein n=1 Tax=Agrobacterium tumefaciens str. Kerr 14 TaxID=1183424 RepID=A0A1S7QVU1_AGRTU|nr:hypothetical protein AGR4C_Cc90011 [Agrobacterium tumefaciens str. Kerr 14]
MVKTVSHGFTKFDEGIGWKSAFVGFLTVDGAARGTTSVRTPKWDVNNSVESLSRLD